MTIRDLLKEMQKEKAEVEFFPRTEPALEVGSPLAFPAESAEESDLDKLIELILDELMGPLER